MLDFVTPATETRLVSTDDAKAELGITGSANDAAVSARILEISTEIAGRCNRANFGDATAEERRQVTCGSKYPLWLRHWPVTSIVSVTEDGTALTGDDYLLAEGRQLLRRDAETGHFTGWRGGDIIVRYQGGYSLPGGCPADLKRAALTMIAASWRQTGRDPSIRSVEVPGVMSETYMLPGALPAAVDATLSRYRNLNTG